MNMHRKLGGRNICLLASGKLLRGQKTSDLLMKYIISPTLLLKTRNSRSLSIHLMDPTNIFEPYH